MSDHQYAKSKLPSRDKFKSTIGGGSDWPDDQRLLYCFGCQEARYSKEYELKKHLTNRIRRLKIYTVNWYKYKYLPVVRKIIKI
jgi:hypothetical protein